MARRRCKNSVDWLIRQVDAQLDALGRDRTGLNLRQKVLRLVELYEGVKDLNVSVLAEHGLDARTARERIRLYLLEYPGAVIDGAEIAVVSGISDYARRVRELRVEEGYQIASGASPDPNSGIELKPDQYLLVDPRPDRDAARRWHVANRIRRSTSGSKNRVLRYLLENVGRVVTTEELAYVARNAREYARRVRELRTEDGYAVATRFTGRPDLKIGQYVLQSKDRIAEPHDRRIPQEVEREVYARDNNTCRICGWTIDRWRVEDPRILELHHLKHHRRGGENVAGNLVVVCSRCHDEVHTGKHAHAIGAIAQSL